MTKKKDDTTDNETIVDFKKEKQKRKAYNEDGVIEPITHATGQRIGKIENSLLNIKQALKFIGIRAKYDDLAAKLLIAYPEKEEWKEVSDNDLAICSMRIDARFNNSNIHVNSIDIALTNIGMENMFHAFEDYLLGLPKFEGESVIDQIPSKSLGCADTPLNRELLRILLVAAVRRCRNRNVPGGTKYDMMLILQGQQGAMKSSFFKALVPQPQMFNDNVDPRTKGKETIEDQSGLVIGEWGELRHMKTAETAAVKAWFSRAVDSGRLAYGRRTTVRNRQMVVVGSTNDPEFLTDSTGNRRFPVIKVFGVVPNKAYVSGSNAPKNFVDVDWIVENRDRLWSEAVALERKGYKIWLDGELSAALEQEQEEFNEKDNWSELLKDMFNAESMREMIISASDIFESWGLNKKDYDAYTVRRLTKAARSAGVSTTRIRSGKDKNKRFFWVWDGELDDWQELKRRYDAGKIVEKPM